MTLDVLLPPEKQNPLLLYARNFKKIQLMSHLFVMRQPAGSLFLLGDPVLAKARIIYLVHDDVFIKFFCSQVTWVGTI